jgi:predicted phosphoribosyltransferase
MRNRFIDRTEAGKLLAAKLTRYAGHGETIVLALPRGGVPVAFEVARELGAPLDVFVVRKLGLPGQEELAMGAIATGGIRVLNREVVTYLAVPESIIDRVAWQEQRELERRERLYRGDRPALAVKGLTAILVDDGLATGSTMLAAITALKELAPGRIVVAVPVAPPTTLEELENEVDEVVCVLTPEPFDGVGRWYQDFSQTTDDEVRSLLERSATRVLCPDASGSESSSDTLRTQL